MTTSKKKLTLMTLRAAAKKLGAEVNGETIDNEACYTVDAPAGKVWETTGDVHMLTVWWRTDEPGFRDNAIADALERMELGLTDCDDPECDYCHPENSRES